MNDNVALSGRLNFLSLGDILQFLGSSGSTGVLRLMSHWASDPGFIYFVDGNPINAQNGEVEGLDALYSLFGWLDGSFDFTQESVLAEKRIAKSRMGIILEGMKLLDDGHTKKIGPSADGDGGSIARLSKVDKSIVKGPLVDYMYVVDEEDFFDGEHIVEQGKHGSWMWVILEGVVDIVKETASGTIPIIRMGNGSFIGSIASFLLQGHIRTATAVAVGNVQLGVLDSQRLAQEYASMSYDFRRLLASLDRRFKQLTECVVSSGNGTRPAMSRKGQDVLIRDGSAKDKQLYVVEQGQASVVRNTKDGPIVLCQLQKGDFFGEMPFLHLGPDIDKAAIYGSQNTQFSKFDAASLQQEYNRLSTTFKNIVDNTTNCMSITAEMVVHSHNAVNAATAAVAGKSHHRNFKKEVVG
jgi:CRP-like cAMP-binding protein